MSEPGPSEASRVTQATSPPFEVPTSNSHATHGTDMPHPRRPESALAVGYNRTDAAVQTDRPPVDLRVPFEEFAAQLRRQRHSEYKRRMLEHRRTELHKAVALTGRLQRLSSWLHDGLVEISKSNNATDFVRVHQHLLELTSQCIGRWNHDIRTFDSLASGALHAPDTNAHPSFLSRISPTAQNDCLEFIQNVRSNPRFLADRFKAVHPSQLVALSTAPRYSDPTPYLTTLSPSRSHSSRKKRISSYAKNLEEYANQFERKNAMAFLVHNCFGAHSATEDLLRLDTWSSICSTLWLDMGGPFLSFFHQILWEFAGLSMWRAKARLELFLMNVLQRGAFLLEPIGDFKQGALDAFIADTLATETAREFFDDAIQELFTILAEEDGGFPLGVLQLVRAMLSKIPDEQLQSEVRGWVLVEWLLGYFLQTAITFPENHRMLLQFYISDNARSTILSGLWRQANTRGSEILQKTTPTPSEERLLGKLHAINNQLYAEALPPVQDIGSMTPSTMCALAFCATDLIHVLEALSQQYTGAASHFEPFVHSLMTAFNSQRDSPKLDRLRRELQLLVEPGHSLGVQELLQEDWLIISVTGDKQLRLPDPEYNDRFGTLDSTYRMFDPLDSAQKAAIRLAFHPMTEDRSLDSDLPVVGKPLYERLLQREQNSRSVANLVDAQFWASALDYLDNNYPLSTTKQSDVRLLEPLVRRLRAFPDGKDSSREDQIGVLEANLASQQRKLDDAAALLQHLKIKMWYTISVVTSREYENARNVTKALNYMSIAPPISSRTTNRDSSNGSDRPGTSTSTTSSLFEQPRLETMNILRASNEHGGPKKLSDEQIEVTKGWLDRNNIDNFCRGEERIHRFCMEVKITTRKLICESASESPVLWYSELWAQEREWFEVSPQTIGTLPGSTRPPSVISESFSSGPWPKPVFGSTPSSRSLDADLPRRGATIGHGTTRISQDILGNELTSSFATATRPRSVNTAESVLTSHSSVPSQTRSVTSTSGPSQASSIWSGSSAYYSRSQTSASIHSRPTSLYSEFRTPKSIDTSAEKAQFLASLRASLTVLLLSDLGNPVWSSGSETDAWLSAHKKVPSIAQRLERRQRLSGLFVAEADLQRKQSQPVKRLQQRRTLSIDDHQTALTDASKNLHFSDVAHLDADKLYELDEVLRKISRQVDANAKMQGVYDLRQLALAFLEQQRFGTSIKAHQHQRRQSLGPGVAAFEHTNKHAGMSDTLRTENEIRDYLKDLLLKLNPQTLFRDLQYIAAFASPDVLNKADHGEAFVQVGLAALASKDEICRIMGELADKIISRDGIKRLSSDGDRESSLLKARDYWIIGAREGNAIAQRELAGLYLAHPEISMPPAVTAPLSLSSEVFRSDMVWSQDHENKNQQALCLALHWMQLAADGGDPIAKRRLEERKNMKVT